MPEAPPSPITGVDWIDYDLPCAACGYNLRTLRTNATCPECGHPVPASIEAAKFRPGWFTLESFPILSRIVLVLLGVAWPLAPFGIMEADPHLFVEWQSGSWSDTLGLTLGGPAARPFYPLLLFAAAAMVALISLPRDMGRRAWVQLGLALGVVLGAQFTIVFAVAIGDGEPMPIIIAVFGLVFGSVVIALLGWLLPRRRKPRYWKLGLKGWSIIGGIAGFLLLFYTTLVMLDNDLLFLPGLAIVFGLIGSPWLFAVAYGFALARCLRSEGLPRPGLGALLGLGATAAGYITAWAAAWMLALREYQKLPTQPPGCYIATAAGRGHRWLTGARALPLADGQLMPLTRQLQTLKAGELAIRAASPKLHRALRGVYDAWGPRVASRLTSPWRADLAYLTLVPIAWVTRGILRCLCPGATRWIAGIYGGQRDRLDGRSTRVTAPLWCRLGIPGTRCIVNPWPPSTRSRPPAPR
jgi:hypothetical protein